MTSASELFYQRRSRVGRPSTELPLGLEASSSDRGFHQNSGRRHHHHGHSHTNNGTGRHDLDGCDTLRRSQHVRHACHRVSERPSARFDQASRQYVSNNSFSQETSTSSGRPRVTSNERLPGAVLLARARLLERLRGVSLSGSRRTRPAAFSIHNREYTFGDDLRVVDMGDWGTDFPAVWSPGGFPLQDSTPERDRRQSPKKKPPGLSPEELVCLKMELFQNVVESGGVDDGHEGVSRDCSICLESFSEGEKLIRLPCGHRFHSACLDPWVRACGDCPYCRRDIVVSSSISSSSNRNQF